MPSIDGISVIDDDVSAAQTSTPPLSREVLETMQRKDVTQRSVRQANAVNSRHRLFLPSDLVIPGEISSQASTVGDSNDHSGPPSPQSGVPANFGSVTPGIFRSSYPAPCNVPFLSSLQLRTIITLVETACSQDLVDLIEHEGINHYRIPIPALKTSTATIPLDSTAQVMRLLQDSDNHPLLIHCNKGKHRTGCMVAAYRKLQALKKPGSNIDQTLVEYHEYADPKARAYDEAFISQLRPTDLQAAVSEIENSLSQQVLPTSYSAEALSKLQSEGINPMVAATSSSASSSLSESGEWSKPSQQDETRILTVRNPTILPNSPPNAYGPDLRYVTAALETFGMPTPPETDSDVSEYGDGSRSLGRYSGLDEG